MQPERYYQITPVKLDGHADGTCFSLCRVNRLTGRSTRKRYYSFVPGLTPERIRQLQNMLDTRVSTRDDISVVSDIILAFCSSTGTQSEPIKRPDGD